MKEPQPDLLVDCHHGIYIPQLFAQTYAPRLVEPLTEEQIKDLSHPEQEFYWETWDTVMQNTKLKDDHGNIYYLHQEDDLWAIPEGKELEDFLI